MLQDAKANKSTQRQCCIRNPNIARQVHLCLTKNFILALGNSPEQKKLQLKATPCTTN